jgi:hypothetical protein
MVAVAAALAVVLVQADSSWASDGFRDHAHFAPDDR